MFADSGQGAGVVRDWGGPAHPLDLVAELTDAGAVAP
jgi:hypothetical protein